MTGALAGALLAACSLLAAPAAAKTLPTVTLTSSHQVITWKGLSPDPTGQGYGDPVAPGCSLTGCDTMTLRIQMPAGSFPKGPKHPAPPDITRLQAEGPTDMPGDGVIVAIKWPTDFDQWNLFVEDLSTGKLVGQGLDVDSNSQSVLISQPHNGLYRVTIVPFYTDFNKADLHYKGEVLAFHDPLQRYHGKHALLPAIKTMAPSNFHIADVPPIPSNPTGWRFTPDGTFSNSCYLDEQIQFGSTRCLRFDNDIRNVGAGPLVLRFEYSPTAFSSHCEMTQEIDWTTLAVSDRPAGPCVFHTQHLHFHYKNMGIYQLYAVSPGGRLSKQPVATSHKVGFCTIDVDNYTFGQGGNVQRPRIYSFPTCNIPNAYSTRLPTNSPYGPNGVPEYMGISPGWGDIYTWDLPQQYIDISKLGNGTFEVVSRSNPDGLIMTASRGQETGVTCIRITGSKVTTLRAFRSQSNTAPLPRCRPSAR